MKKILCIFLMIAVIFTLALACTSCRKASIVKNNIAKEADYFNCERRVTAYNARTDTIIFQVEGYISISNDDHNELVVTAKVGVNTYKQSYIYLNDYTLYVVEDITGTHTDEYHYKWYFNPNALLPDIEMAP